MYVETMVIMYQTVKLALNLIWAVYVKASYLNGVAKDFHVMENGYTTIPCSNSCQGVCDTQGLVEHEKHCIGLLTTFRYMLLFHSPKAF